MPECEIDIHREDIAWPENIDTLIFESTQLVWESIPEGAAEGRDGEISVILSHNDHIQSLNAEWRGKDRPTNVLSFAAEEGDMIEFDAMPDEMRAEMPRLLGDIILARETVLQEAENQGKLFEHHFTHLMIHGLLHLFGYDHIEDDEAEVMEQLETRLLKKFGISDPYIAGGGAPDL